VGASVVGGKNELNDRSRLLALLKACHELIQQLERLRVDDDNPFARRIRDTCGSVMARLTRLEIGRGRPRPGHAASSRDAE
jgi:hypothetical protein